MNMFPEFATVYRDSDNKVHLYVFPGIDEQGKQIYRNIDLNSINIKYTYIKHDDKAYEFTFSENVKNLSCKMVHCKTGDIKQYTFKNF